MHPLAKELLAFIADQKVFKGPALIKTHHEAANVYWAVVGRRSGAKLRVSLHDSPAVFDSLDHTRCPVDLKTGRLAKDAEAQVFREVAVALEVPKNGRAIPFSLLIKKGAHFEQNVCAVAVHPLLVGQVGAFSGNGKNGVEAAVFGESEVVAFNAAGYTPTFGRVLMRAPLSTLRHVDLDAERAGFTLKDGREFSVMFQANPKSELARIAALLKRKRVLTRKFVDVGDRSEWQPVLR
ncbi:MAG: hypothetical protein QM817_35535 [Archangium sp.]